jgi:hypothetical protein
MNSTTARFLTCKKPVATKASTLPAPSRLLQRQCACGSTSGLDDQCEGCRPNILALQRLAANGGGPAVAPPIVNDVLNSPGQPLDAATRAFMEPRFGHDFGHVRIHTDGYAAESARTLAAQAYTVGRHVAFAQGRYAPATNSGARLLAHELAHVVQQAGTPLMTPARLMVDEHEAPFERDADAAAAAVIAGCPPRISRRAGGIQLQRHKDDAVAYTGGQSGSLFVIKAGSLIFTGPAVSGHPGHGEWEPSIGPTPTGNYVIHPGEKRPTVAALQAGVCGARAISSGYQEITSTDPSPCSGAHYCNVPCPTQAELTRMCFTPKDCWGPMRIKIEGSADVATPAGRMVHRDGFYLHGGNPSDAVSSGCIKTLDNGVFPKVRTLAGVGGAVPFCVGEACPQNVKDVIFQELMVQAIEGIKSFVKQMDELRPVPE